jgi:hypothetical protein
MLSANCSDAGLTVDWQKLKNMILPEIPLTVAAQIEELYDEIADAIALKRCQIEIIDTEIELIQKLFNEVQQQRIDRQTSFWKEKTNLESDRDEIQNRILEKMSRYNNNTEKNASSNFVISTYKVAIATAFENESLTSFALSQQANLCRHVHFLTMHENQIHAMKSCCNENIRRLELEKEIRLLQNEMEIEKLSSQHLQLQQELEQLGCRLVNFRTMQKEAYRRIKKDCKLNGEYEILSEIATLFDSDDDNSSSNSGETFESSSNSSVEDDIGDDDNNFADINGKSSSLSGELQGTFTENLFLDKSLSSTRRIQNTSIQTHLHLNSKIIEDNRQHLIQIPFKIPSWSNENSTSFPSNPNYSHANFDRKSFPLWITNSSNNKKVSINDKSSETFSDNNQDGDDSRLIQSLISNFSKTIELNVAELREKMLINSLYQDKSTLKEDDDDEYFSPTLCAIDSNMSIDNFLDESLGSDFEDIDITDDILCVLDEESNPSYIISHELVIESIGKMRFWFSTANTDASRSKAGTSTEKERIDSHFIARSLHDRKIFNSSGFDCIHTKLVKQQQHLFKETNDSRRPKIPGQTKKIKLRDD